ncbi:MAG: DUF4190 domain-containing protein [Pseudonocardiales bacterium]
MSQPPGPPLPPYATHPAPYGPQPPQYGGYPPQGPPTNTMAIVSLVAAFVFFPAGLICGFIARSQIKKTGEQGAGLALAGIIISICQLVILIVAFGFFIFAFLAIGTAVSHFPTPSPFPTS